MANTYLTGNFLATARCLIFADSGTGVWSFDPNTNTLSITAAGGIEGTANPSAKVGPTTVNGSAGTAMRSDAAPAIDLTADYPWSGKVGWFGNAAIVQPTTAVGSAAFVQVDLTMPVSQDSTFDGYTIAQVVKAIRNLGLLA